LGVNDGLVSIFLLVIGLVGASESRTSILASGFAAAIAGAISMGIGEYVATKSQLEVTEGELKLEREHFKYHRDIELDQLRQYLKSLNLDGDLLEAVISHVGRSDDSLLKVMLAFEFGVGSDVLEDSAGERNPLKAMFMSGRLFLIGCIPSIFPFFIPQMTVTESIITSSILVGIALFAVGAYKTKTTRGSWWKGGMENFLFGVIGGAISFCVGLVFDIVRQRF